MAYDKARTPVVYRDELIYTDVCAKGCSGRVKDMPDYIAHDTSYNVVSSRSSHPVHIPHGRTRQIAVLRFAMSLRETVLSKQVELVRVRKVHGLQRIPSDRSKNGKVHDSVACDVKPDDIVHSFLAVNDMRDSLCNVHEWFASNNMLGVLNSVRPS